MNSIDSQQIPKYFLLSNHPKSSNSEQELRLETSSEN